MRTGVAHLPLHGGKDGTPFPVDRPTYGQTIEILNKALNGASADRTEKVKAFQRLSRFEHAVDRDLSMPM
jgi:hypothetical protein